MTSSVDVERRSAFATATAESGKDWNPSLRDQVVRDYIIDAAGEQGLLLAEIIEESQPILGVDLVELVEDKPSNVRRSLYKLEEARVAQYATDTDKSGWETFTWTLSLNEVKYVINRERKALLEHLRNRLNFEELTTFFQCPEEHPRVDFETGTELGFRCPTCDLPMDNVDNTADIERLKEQIAELEAVVF